MLSLTLHGLFRAILVPSLLLAWALASAFPRYRDFELHPETYELGSVIHTFSNLTYRSSWDAAALVLATALGVIAALLPRTSGRESPT